MTASCNRLLVRRVRGTERLCYLFHFPRNNSWETVYDWLNVSTRKSRIDSLTEGLNSFLILSTFVINSRLPNEGSPCIPCPSGNETSSREWKKGLGEAAGTEDLHDNGVAGKLISLQFGTRPIEW